MKIIHFIASIDKTAGGTTAYMKLLASELKNDTKFIIACGYSPTPIEIPGITIHFFNCNLNRLFKLKQEFKRFLQNEQPDIVHINGIWNPQNAVFQKTAQELGIKVVLAPHGMLEPYILNRNPWKKKLALFLYQHKAIQQADYIHATAESELKQIQKLGYDQEAFIVPNGIDLSEIKSKMHYGSSGNTLKLLFLSRVHPKKGIEFLIDSIDNLLEHKLILKIAGPGEKSYIDSLKNKIKTKGLQNIIEFVGPVFGDKKWELYKESDLFILPTYSENFGIVIAEALATGLPVITTTGTPWEELHSYQCGWWIDLSVNNLTNVLQEAMNTSTEELQQMGLRGKALIKSNYSIENVAISLKNVYQQILAQ